NLRRKSTQMITPVTVEEIARYIKDSPVYGIDDKPYEEKLDVPSTEPTNRKLFELTFEEIKRLNNGQDSINAHYDMNIFADNHFERWNSNYEAVRSEYIERLRTKKKTIGELIKYHTFYKFL
ncbi:MAG: hypothetical protein K0B02_04815, partial [DPANN group archaeon]|nr:hypothetical protein [DPANN group archaeon]